MLGDIAEQAGIVLDIARIFRAAETEIAARRRAEEVQRFLAETSALLSWSLDYPESYERLAQLCVPFLADLCVIDVADDTRHPPPGRGARGPGAERVGARRSKPSSRPTRSAPIPRRVSSAAGSPRWRRR